MIKIKYRIKQIWFHIKRPKFIFRWIVRRRNTILWNDKWYRISVDGVSFLMPNENNAYYALEEVFLNEFYIKLSWMNHVLDLGGYIWDSAIYLAKRNKYVTVYEADPANYKYLEKNIAFFDNIDWYNNAVVWDKSLKSVKIYAPARNMMWTSIISQKQRWAFCDVETAWIWEIMKENQFDGLKMDIEWAEYGVLDRMIKNEEFWFERWYIEFHILEHEKFNSYEMYTNIIFYLTSNWYNVDLYNAFTNDKLDIEKFSHNMFENIKIVYVYFNL